MILKNPTPFMATEVYLTSILILSPFTRLAFRSALCPLV
jgi:hypothetical protein